MTVIEPADSFVAVLRARDIELDRLKLRVRRRGYDIHLRPAEFRLLEFLLRTPGRVYSRREILENVWGAEKDADERTVDVHIGRLRKLLAPDTIRTVRGRGYSFNELA